MTQMPRTLQEIIDHADDMSAAFDDYQPDPATLRDPAPMLRARTAVQARAQAEADVAAAVTDMRDAGYSWAAIGMVLGTSGEAARQRYGDAPAESAPARTSTRSPRAEAKAVPAPKAPRTAVKVAATSRATAAKSARAATGALTRAAASSAGAKTASTRRTIAR